jgi:hypothetical protein
MACLDFLSDGGLIWYDQMRCLNAHNLFILVTEAFLYALSSYFMSISQVKDMAFSSLKMSIYEATARFYLTFFMNKHGKDAAKNLTPSEGAVVGCGSGILTSFLTMPLDTVNTRIKSGELANMGIIKAHSTLVREEGILSLFRGIGPRTFTIGVGSTLFWYAYAKAKAVLGGINVEHGENNGGH